MARYFFHLRDEAALLREPEGADFSDFAAVPALAMRQARSILSHDVLEGEINLAQWIEVADERDEIVHRLHFADALSITGLGRR